MVGFSFDYLICSCLHQQPPLCLFLNENIINLCLQFNSILYSLQEPNIVTTGGTYMISKYVSIIVVKFTMGEQQKIYNDI